MTSFYLAPCLVTLRAEIDKVHPKRDRRSDGWVGDTSHSARPSDHNPDYADGGVVRAFDVDKDGVNTTRLLAVVIKHSSTNYVIWNGYIYSRAYGFRKRVYTGTNKHNHHMHISIRHGKIYENNTKRWGYTATTTATTNIPYYGDCRPLQKALRQTPDNFWGQGTDKAADAVRWAAQTKFPFGVKFAQRVVGVKDDGAWGGASRRALQATILSAQTALIDMSHTKFARTGVWDTPTESAYQKVRKICRRP